MRKHNCSSVVFASQYTTYKMQKESQKSYPLSFMTSWAWIQSKVSLWTMSNWLWWDMWRTGMWYYFLRTLTLFSNTSLCHYFELYLYWNGHHGFYAVFQFDPESKLSKDDPRFNKSPTDNNKVHVLVCVVAANTGSRTRAEIVQKIREIRSEASDLGERKMFLFFSTLDWRDWKTSS